MAAEEFTLWDDHRLLIEMYRLEQANGKKLDALQVSVDKLLAFHKIVGINVDFGAPVDRSASAPKSQQQQGNHMTSVSLVKKGALKPKTAGAKATGTNFAIVDNQDDSLTVNGVDAAGASVDISSVATITVVSDTPAVLTADAPVGMTDTVHGVTPGTANLTITATWNDGSIGPFTFLQPVTVGGGPATGLTVTFGTPTARP